MKGKNKRLPVSIPVLRYYLLSMPQLDIAVALLFATFRQWEEEKDELGLDPLLILSLLITAACKEQAVVCSDKQ